jgi:ribosome-binding protein aMBF1 (putative translation factor)
MTTSQPTQAPETTAPVGAITPADAVRATWKQHGNPTAAFIFYGTAVKTASETGVAVAKVVTDPQGITLKGANGRAIKGGRFGNATKFWAVVPADAPRQAPKATEPKAKADPLAKVEIVAPKGGDKFVTPIKGAVAKAIAATGESIQAIARKHGQNPSQLRRLAADGVAKVDQVRAESIAKALGVKMADLFGAPEVKASKAVKTPAAPKPTTGKGSKSKATKAAEKVAAEQAEREAAEAAEATAAQAAAEGTQETPGTDTPAADQAAE